MNKFQIALSEIKKIMGVSDDTKLELASAKFKDGTEVKYDKLEIGGVVTIVSADGSETPLPAGSYELEDGKILEVDENGIILKYEDKPVETESDVKAETDLADEPVNDLEKRVADLEAKLLMIEQSLNDTIGLSKTIATSTTDLSKKLEMATDAKPLKRTPDDEAKEFDSMTPYQQHKYFKNKK